MGHTSVVSILIKAGADGSIKSHDGKTALDRANDKGKWLVAQILADEQQLEKG